MLSAWQHQAAERALVGSWQVNHAGQSTHLVLRDDHTFTFNDREGHFTVDAESITLAGRFVVTYTWALGDDGGLTLSGGDLQRPITLIPQPQTPSYVAWLFDVSPETIWRRLQRILVIIGIVLAARGVIWAIRWVSHTLIFADWGPLGLVYRHRKNRARTLHSLVLNCVKYFIYFTAAGTILSEMGINYTTYIASLSVIGLAIGFGSQSLVQDVVTGFFVIFEEQFDVGDMVELGGQTGIVQEIGLRSTRLRNYLGQIVVIPNRNITTVANYSRGAQRTYVDVQVESEEAARRAMPILEQLGNEMMKQYGGVVLGPIRATGPTVLATGEVFVRLHLSIWPGQTWVVENQLVPRVKERLAAAEVPIVSDRVAVYHHARERIEVTGLLDRFNDLRERLPFFRRRDDPKPPLTTQPPPNT